MAGGARSTMRYLYHDIWSPLYRGESAEPTGDRFSRIDNSLKIICNRPTQLSKQVINLGITRYNSFVLFIECKLFDVGIYVSTRYVLMYDHLHSTYIALSCLNLSPLAWKCLTKWHRRRGLGSGREFESRSFSCRETDNTLFLEAANNAKGALRF